MEQKEIFQILGIEPTKDEKLLKQVYREKLAVTNPEDNPEGFKRLRQAYEEACRYARTDEEEKEEEDTSPSGMWVKKFDALYHTLHGRQDEEAWRQLFEEEEFQSLEGEEECKRKLFIFLMDNFKLPTKIWKLLDEKLEIVKGEKELLEHFPRDFINYIVSCVKNGEEVEFEQFEGAEDADYDAFLRCYENCWRAIQNKDYEYAMQLLEEGDRMNIYHPVAELNRAFIYKNTGKEKEAIECIEAVWRKYPEDDLISYHTAKLYWEMEKKEEAAKIFEDLKARMNKHYAANLRLAEWYYEKKEYQKAKECAEQVMSIGYDDDFYELLKKINEQIEKELKQKVEENNKSEDIIELCWCYLQDEKFCWGLQRALEIKDRVPKERQTEYLGLLAKLYRESALYEDAIRLAQEWMESLEEKIKQNSEDEEERKADLGRIQQAHMIKVTCYHAMAYENKDYYQSAMEEISKIGEKEQQKVEVLLEQARMYMEMEEYEKALEITELLVEEKQVYAAHATAMEVYRRQWDAGGVLHEGRACINYFPEYSRAYEQMAKVYLDLGYQKELTELLKEAKENNAWSIILEAYEYQSCHKVMERDELDKKLQEFEDNYETPLNNGQSMDLYREGLPIITEYLYQRPGNYLLMWRGIFHKIANHFEEAKEDYKKALEEHPADACALNNLGEVYFLEGNYDKAIVYYRKAMRYYNEKEGYKIYRCLADLFELLGENKLAAEAYDKLAKHVKRRSQVQFRGAIVVYAMAGRDADAKKLNKALYYQSDLLEYYDNLKSIYYESSNWKGMKDTFEKWRKELLRRKKYKQGETNWFSYYNHLAMFDLEIGEVKDAWKYFLKAYDQAVKDGSPDRGILDVIFYCILFQKKKEGIKYAKKLRQVRENMQNINGEENYRRYSQKYLLYMKVAEAYFLEGSLAAWELLKQEKNTFRCRRCTIPICQELQAIRCILLIEMGRKEEAKTLLKETLKIQPTDTYARYVKIYSCKQ